MEAAAPAVQNPFEEARIRYRKDPVLFVREVFGVDPYPDQIELLEAYARRDKRIAKRSGHGPGKTASLAWCILHHSLFYFRQKTVCTAPTQKQLFDALYAETVKWYNMLPEAWQILEIKSESLEHKGAPKECFASFRTSSRENPEALAGVHEEYVLLIVDEASAVANAIFESASGSMSGHNAITILTGNPTRRTGLFYDIFNKPSVMALWTRLHVSSVGHPNVDQEYVQLVKAQYGENSNTYRVRILGEFPLIDDDTVIPFELLDLALHRDVKPQVVKPIWGIDVARKGRDASAMCKRQGNVLMEPVRIWRGKDTMETAGIIKAEWDRTIPSLRPSEINVDIIGIGAGVADRLRQLGLPARGINVSESAAMDDRFVRLRSELWWKGREWFEKRDSALWGTGWEWIPAENRWAESPGVEWKDDFLASELALPTFDYSDSGKIVVEPKKKTMARTDSESPNRADAFLLTLASEAITAAGTDKQPVSWNKPLQREIKGLV